MTSSQPVAPPASGGYGWNMDDSARLQAEVERRARRAPSRAPIGQVINQIAARQGVDLERMNDPQLGDKLIAEKDAALREERIRRQVAIHLASLPPRFREADFPATDFGRDARRWLEEFRAARSKGEPGRRLVILGDPGAGKTWTACAIARELLITDVIPTTVITTADMLAAMRPGGDGLEVDMVQFALAPVLVLDDFGVEKLTEWAAEQLYRLADMRYREARPTIVTSNLTGEQIKARYDRRTVERLFGGAQLIQIAGGSLRQLPF